jgi:hypothetical protein
MTPLALTRVLRLEARRAEFEALPHAKLIVDAINTIENLVQENTTLLKNLQTQAKAFGEWCDKGGLDKPSTSSEPIQGARVCS